MAEKRFTSQQEARIVKAYKSGTGSYSLSKEYECFPATILGVLRRHGVKIRPSTREGAKSKKVTKGGKKVAKKKAPSPRSGKKAKTTVADEEF